MIKVVIILYTVMLGYYFILPDGLQSPKMWPVYHVWDHIAGGGCLLWFFAWKHSVKYKSACFYTLIFSVFRLAWLIYCYLIGIPPDNTIWVMWLFMGLIPVIYITLFIPNGRLTKFIDNHLTMLPKVKKN